MAHVKKRLRPSRRNRPHRRWKLWLVGGFLAIGFCAWLLAYLFLETAVFGPARTPVQVGINLNFEANAFADRKESVSGPKFRTVTKLFGWTVSGGTLDLYSDNGDWAWNGFYHLDLFGGTNAETGSAHWDGLANVGPVISQQLKTVPGHTYRVSFRVSGSADSRFNDAQEVIAFIGKDYDGRKPLTNGSDVFFRTYHNWFCPDTSCIPSGKYQNPWESTRLDRNLSRSSSETWPKFLSYPEFDEYHPLNYGMDWVGGSFKFVATGDDQINFLGVTTNQANTFAGPRLDRIRIVAVGS